MNFNRSRASGPSRRLETVFENPWLEDWDSDALTDTETVGAVNSKAAGSQFIRPKSSGVRDEGNDLAAHETTDAETDTDSIKKTSCKPRFIKVLPAENPIGISSPPGDEDYYSTGTETDTETLKPSVSPKPRYSIPEPAEDSSDVRSPEGDEQYSPDFESDNDDADTVVSISPKETCSSPAPPMTYSDVRSLEGAEDESTCQESDDAATVVSVPMEVESDYSGEDSSGVRTEIPDDDTPRVPHSDLDDAEAEVISEAEAEVISEAEAEVISEAEAEVSSPEMEPHHPRRESSASCPKEKASELPHFAFLAEEESEPEVSIPQVKSRHHSGPSSATRAEEWGREEKAKVPHHDSGDEQLEMNIQQVESRHHSRPSSAARIEKRGKDKKPQVPHPDSDEELPEAPIVQAKSTHHLRPSSAAYAERKEKDSDQEVLHLDSDVSSDEQPEIAISKVKSRHRSRPSSAARTEKREKDEKKPKVPHHGSDDEQKVVKSRQHSIPSIVARTEKRGKDNKPKVQQSDSDEEPLEAPIVQAKSRHHSRPSSAARAERWERDSKQDVDSDVLSDEQPEIYISNVKSRHHSRPSSAVRTEKREKYERKPRVPHQGSDEEQENVKSRHHSRPYSAARTEKRDKYERKPTVPHQGSDEEQEDVKSRHHSRPSSAARTEKREKYERKPRVPHRGSDEEQEDVKSRHHSRPSSAVRTERREQYERKPRVPHQGSDEEQEDVKSRHHSSPSSAVRTEKREKYEKKPRVSHHDDEEKYVKSRHHSRPSKNARTEKWEKDEVTEAPHYDSYDEQMEASIPRMKSRHHLRPPGAEKSKKVEKKKVPYHNSDDEDPDIHISQARHYSGPFSGARSEELYYHKNLRVPHHDSDVERPEAPIPQAKSLHHSRSSSGARSKKTDKHEKSKVQCFDLDDEKSVVPHLIQVKPRRPRRESSDVRREKSVKDKTSYLDDDDSEASTSKQESNQTSMESSAVLSYFDFLNDEESEASTPNQDEMQQLPRKSSAVHAKKCPKGKKSELPCYDFLEDEESEASTHTQEKSRQHSRKSSAVRTAKSTKDKKSEHSHFDFLDDEESELSTPTQEKLHEPSREVSAVRTERWVYDEKPRVPYLDLDDMDSDDTFPPQMKSNRKKPIVPLLELEDLETIDDTPCCTLKSIEARSHSKSKGSSRHETTITCVADQLSKIDSKNMLFFPSSNLTRPSIETIYGPVKRRSPRLLHTSVRSSRTTSTLNSFKSKMSKTVLMKNTPQQEAGEKPSTSAKETPSARTPKKTVPISAEEPSTSYQTEPKAAGDPAANTTQNIEPNISAPNRAGPVKPKPFIGSGCGKGIPSLSDLPKPELGKIPAYILKRRKESLRSRSLDTLCSTDIQPAIPSAVQKDSKASNDVSTRKSRKTAGDSATRPRSKSLFARNNTSLEGESSQSGEKVLVSCLKKKNKRNGPAKRKRRVTFRLPVQVRYFSAIPEGAPECIYTDDCRRQCIELFEKPPIFKDGVFPETEPSRSYLKVMNKGFDFSHFSPKEPISPAPTIPYNVLDKYLPMYNDNLERIAVHMKYGMIGDCICDDLGDGPEYCERHIDRGRLQYYYEVVQVMVGLLSIKFEVPEYNEAEDMFREMYPNIYECWVTKKECRLSMHYRVREAKSKFAMVQACEKVLEEEDLLAEFLQIKDDMGHKRSITISGLIENVEEDFEHSYSFLFEEYSHLFIQLIEKFEFIPLAIERMMIGTYRKEVVEKANFSEEILRNADQRKNNKVKNEDED